MGLFSFLNKEIAIDLGTANTLIIYKDQVVVDEPSIVAIDKKTSQVIAVGTKAMLMHEKTHANIETIRPLKDGVIADFTAAEAMLRGFINMLTEGSRWFRPSLTMVICIPSGVTEVEKRAVIESAEHANARERYLIHEPMAGALGIGLDVELPEGNMIIAIWMSAFTSVLGSFFSSDTEGFCSSAISGAITRATIDMSLIRILSDGPEVSLKGSPTVSPTTAALS